MKNAGDHLELVHVLRHSFRPTQQLGQAIEQFVPPESEYSHSSIHIKSLGKISLDPVLNAQYVYAQQLINARSALETHKGHPLEITPDIKVRKVGETTLTILMGVKNKVALRALTRQTNAYLPGTVSEREDVSPDFSLYTRISSSVPITDAFQAEAEEQFRERYEQYNAAHLFSVIPDGIAGIDQFRRVANNTTAQPDVSLYE